MNIAHIIKNSPKNSTSQNTAIAQKASDGTPRYISVDKITPNRFQPRKTFDTNSLLRLADSIRRYGILQPITVRAFGSAGTDDESYEIVCGERRYRAAIIAGFTSVPCIIVSSGDMNSAELSIIENLLRDDLNIFEQAESFNLLITTFNLTQEEVANRISLSQSAVANKLRLLKFTQPERELILEAGLTERHARALLRVPDSATRTRFIKTIGKDKLNVAATEALIDNYLQYISKNGNETCKNSAHSSKFSTGIVKDIRILTNTIEKAAATLRKSGIFVEIKSEETSASYCVIVSVFKKTQ